MGCSSSTELINPNFVDNSHFETHTTIGKGGFGHVHMVVKKSGEDKDTMYANKRQVIHDIIKKKMHAEIYRELDFLKDLCHPFLCNAHYGRCFNYNPIILKNPNLPC
jgi:serine/threonine protein kinase